MKAITSYLAVAALSGQAPANSLLYNLLPPIQGVTNIYSNSEHFLREDGPAGYLGHFSWATHTIDEGELVGYASSNEFYDFGAGGAEFGGDHSYLYYPPYVNHSFFNPEDISAGMGLRTIAPNGLYGISTHGSFLAGDYTTNIGAVHAFVYSTRPFRSWRDLGSLAGAFGFSHAQAVNEFGESAGTTDTPSGDRHAFFNDRFGMHDIGDLGGGFSAGYAINSSHQIAGFSVNANGLRRAFLYTNGVMSDLGSINGGESIGFDMNSLGEVVGWSTVDTGGADAFIYSSGTMTDLANSVGGRGSIAFGVNRHHEVVGGGPDAGGRDTGILWRNGVGINLNSITAGLPYRWRIIAAYGISDTGYIAAIVEDPFDQVYGALMQPIHPEQP